MRPWGNSAAATRPIVSSRHLRLRHEETGIELERPMQAPHDFALVAVIRIKQNVVLLWVHDGGDSDGKLIACAHPYLPCLLA